MALFGTNDIFILELQFFSHKMHMGTRNNMEYKTQIYAKSS